MFNKLWRYLNPLAHLGEKKYSFYVPLLSTIFVYILSEIFAYIIFKQPNKMGNTNVVITFLLIIYFSFRFGIKGGLTTVGTSIVFFTYFIVSRQASFAEKELATTVATALTVVYGILAVTLGGLRQTIDNLFEKEHHARVRAEDAEEKFKTLANNIPNFAWMAKADGYVFWYNSRWYEYTGKAAKDMEGWGWESVQDPHLLPDVLKRWKTSIKTGQPFEMVFPLKGKDGNFRPFLTRIVPVKNSKGEIIYWFGTNTDISEQEELNKRKDEFIAMASHELKTPLTSMKVFTQILLKEFKNNPKATLSLKRMSGQVDKLTALVSEMLNTSKIQQGKLQLTNEPFIIKHTALEIISDLQAITNHKLIVKWQTNELVFADKERLRQVITNLITNAIKYSPEEKEIIIRSQKVDKTVVVSVLDFGIGIPKADQAHIFDRFYQVKENNANTYPGLGLGLYISHEIITRMGGNMWVKSQKGKGSTFFFSLPIYKTT